MAECGICKHAILDFEEYYGTSQKEWFVDGCKKDCDPDDCNEFEEVDTES